MAYTIKEIMLATCGTDTYPRRWETFFDEVMATYEKNGCPLLDPAYYTAIEEEYGIIGEDLPVYLEAAQEIAKDEMLSRYMALLCHALTERDTIKADLAEISFPTDDENSLKCRMLPALAMCQGVRYADGLLKARGVPDPYRQTALRTILGTVKGYRIRHGGEYGCFAFGWFQLAYDAKLFIIDSLQIELSFPSMDFFSAYENTKGEIVSLARDVRVHKSGIPLGSLFCEDETDAFDAVFTETADAYIGNPYDEKGRIRRERVTLPKSEWHEKLVPGDEVINLHIPQGVPFTEEALDQTMADIRAFLAKYFPDHAYKAFFCGSWLLDPQLGDLLGEDSNIAKFGRRFTPVSAKSDGMGVFRFAFLMPNNDIDFEALPEKTRLQRAVKQHYLAGKAVYGVCGFFF